MIPYLTCYNGLPEDKPLGSKHVHVKIDNVKIKYNSSAFRLSILYHYIKMHDTKT